MKFPQAFLFLQLFFTFFFFLQAEDCSPTKPILKHEASEWTVGTIVPIEKAQSLPLTDSYEEMLKNHDKKIISLGLNNSGLVNLKDTVVISDSPQYLYEDGITGKVSQNAFLKKNTITDSYEEMLKNRNTRIISMQVNRTAFYDPDNQVVVKGTGEMPVIDPLDNYYANKIGKMESPEINNKVKTAGKLKFLE